MIEIINVSKKFDSLQALNNISFNIKKGEIVSIIGTSGAGKTTLLRIINGLEKCNSGSISIDNINLFNDSNYCSKKDLKNIHKKLSCVFQNFNLFPHMTVLENIMEAPINVLKMPKEDSYKKAIDILTSLSLEDKENNFPFQLSGGQKQRVAIARALMINPNYICFDEPTSALDPRLTDEVGSIIKDLSFNELGIFIITHDINFAKKFSTKIIQLEKGEIVNTFNKSQFEKLIL
ncbi:amino acid ABC transporter ATP-binding protein [Clostridium tarantellae]|uniref:ATP-binding cassette domain-containing protein n=1 Tax=Clostridium tarantellae TaxID=39493 RepID=A0A6I1ML63_9CLOT|nr:amino acid ABC transporter ATP-binding protein [Clostridium tarantellae]MPQ43198.1 ATP-binding cassette domain-containing protein [Clostridium tarantellae]